jgi:hypothetical protein
MSAFILLLIGIAFQLISQTEQSATTLPILTSLDDALRSEEEGREMMIGGRVSEQNDELFGTGYVAYVRSEGNGESADYQLPNLLLELKGGVVEIEQGIYEPYSWNEDSTTAPQVTRFLMPNDEVVVYGQAYLGEAVRDGVGEARLFLSAPFVFQGSASEFESELAPALRRRATLAQIASVFSFTAALIVLLSPLPTGVRLLRNRQ